MWHSISNFITIKKLIMANQQDRDLETSGEANQDKNDNSSTEKNINVNPGSEKSNDEDGDDNGFFTDEDNTLQTKEEHEEDKSNRPDKNEKVTPLSPSTSTTLGDRITVNSENEDLVTPVKDDDPDSYNNENDQ